MEKLDCLLIHTPKFNNYYRLSGDFMHTMYIPGGLLSIADCLNKNGFKTKILHLGIEWIKDKKFRLEDYLDRTRPDVVGLSLHWHHQSYDTIRVAGRIKSFDSSIFVVLGGYTTSIFDREILENFPEVDAIIKGDGEIPFLRLCQKRRNFATETTEKHGEKSLNLLNPKIPSVSSSVNSVPSVADKLEDVPNLSWRRDGKIVQNEISFVASQKDMDEFSWTNLSFLENYRLYVKLVQTPYWFKSIPGKINKHIKRFQLGFPLLVGKGCPVNCSYCGGSWLTQKKFTNRKDIVFRSPEKVINSLLEIKKYGYDLIYICFDPYPDNLSYYIDLFKKIRQKNIKIACGFSCYRLPAKEFLEEFKKTFGWSEASFLEISPESGSERVRRLNKGFYYSNADLIESIKYVNKLGIPLNIFFSLGLPFQNKVSLAETIYWIRRLQKFKCVKEVVWSILDLDPGSPCLLFPEKYGVVFRSKSFKDFINIHQNSYKMANLPGARFTKMDYCVKGFLDQGAKNSLEEDKFEKFGRELQKIRCKYSCYFWSKYFIPVVLRRMICGSFDFIWKLHRRINTI